MAQDAPRRLVLWTGPRRSGKTTALAELARRGREEGISTDGILAPAVHEAGALIGYDVVDALTGERHTLARRGTGGQEQVGPFALTAEGLAFGRAVLARARSAALAVVDEYGPLELSGGGWRQAADALLSESSALVVPAVREGLTERVARLYAEFAPRIVPALEPVAIDRVLDLLR